MYRLRNRNDLKVNEINFSSTLKRENLFKKKHKQAIKKCAKHFSSIGESDNVSNLNKLMNSTELDLDEHLNVLLNVNYESNSKQDDALSADELNVDDHCYYKRLKFSANCSNFIDSEAKVSDNSDNDSDEEFDIFDS